MTKLAFPRWAHVPGKTAGADHGPLEAAKALLPARFEGAPPAGDPAILYGVALCDAGFYWESHEVLEAAWMRTAQNGRDRQALRALIQLANAGLKLRMGRHRAAVRLLREAESRLADAGGGASGSGFADALDANGLAAAVSRLIAALGERPDTGALPPVGSHLRR